MDLNILNKIKDQMIDGFLEYYVNSNFLNIDEEDRIDVKNSLRRLLPSLDNAVTILILSYPPGSFNEESFIKNDMDILKKEIDSKIMNFAFTL